MMMNVSTNYYLDDIMGNLGECFDFVYYDCHLDLDEFMNLMVSTGYAEDYEKQNPRVVSGMSGVELALNIYLKAGLKLEEYKIRNDTDLSDAYWAGWILGYYQQVSQNSFRDIMKVIKIKDLLNLYYPYHEAPKEKTSELLNTLISKYERKSKLQEIRKSRGLSQSQLAEKSGVNLRTLQQYELMTKDINKASAKNVKALSKVLGCYIDDLLDI